MNKKRWVLKSISVLLSVVLVLQIVPFSVIAANVTQKQSQETTEIIDMNASETEPEIVGEVVSLRGEYTKHFRREDGSFVAAIYNEPVHYQKNGVWEEVDNTIMVTNNTASSNATVNSANKLDSSYTISKTATPITFPSDIKTGKISVSHNGKSISFGVKNSKSTNTAKRSTLSSADNKVSVSKIEPQLVNEQIDDKLAVNTNNSKITYNDAFENAYLTYEASASMIKESIVIPEKSDNYTYEFTMNFGSYVPVYDELTGGIFIYETADSKDPLMAIAPPYMFDANGETSEDVTMALVSTDSEYALIVEADKEWINSGDRKFPVVVDPTLVLDVGRSGVYDVHVNSGKPNRNYKLDYQLEVGNNGDDVFRIYIKYDLPELPDCSVVINSLITLQQNWLRTFDDDTNDLIVFPCRSDWDFETITWNNQPVQNRAEETMIDYADYVDGMSEFYTLNITKAVKKWYEEGYNYGLMLGSSNEFADEKTSFYSSRNLAGNYPAILIQYVNNTGIEDYWDYETVSLGDSGTAYVNTYNGGLTYVHNDAVTKGLVMPVQVSHVYSTSEQNSSGVFGNMKFGKGFKLNMIEKIEAVDSDQLTDYPYKYIDGDGTVHFFIEQSENTYVYEFGSNIVLTTGTDGYTMSFADGSKKTFNTDGYLTKTTDTNGNCITFFYNNGQLQQMRDGSAINIFFVYNSDNTLNYIHNYAGGRVRFAYSNTGLLTTITYPDGNKTMFEYNSNSILSKIITIDSSQLRLSYNPIKNNVNNTMFYKVSELSYHGNDTANQEFGSMKFTYRTNDTLVESYDINNTKSDELVIAFDNSGRAVNKTLNGKTTVATRYNMDGNLNNTVKSVSNAFSATENLITEPHPALSTDWTKHGTYSTSTDSVNICDTSLFVEATNDTDAYATYRVENITPGQKYTASAYVKVVGDDCYGNAAIKLTAGNSNNTSLLEIMGASMVNTDGEWKIISATIEAPEGAEFIDVSCGVFNNRGSLYIDTVWAEEGSVSNRYNFISNSSFNIATSDKPDSWILSTNASQRATVAAEGPAGNKVLRIPSNREYILSASQTVNSIIGKAEDTLVFGASAKAICSSSGNRGDRFFGMKFIINYTDGTSETTSVMFDKDVYNTWQTVMYYATAKKNYSSVSVILHYDHEIGIVLYDDIFLYRDSYATRYDYNDNGTVSTVKDDNGNQVSYTYTGINVTKATSTANGNVMQETLYSYDSKHNLTSATDSQSGLKTTYSYNAKGLPLTVTVTDSAGQKATTTYTYHSDLNFLTSVTDPTGATTQYSYSGGSSIMKGLVTKVTDPNGNVTEYTYDTNSDLLLSVSNPDESLGDVETQYTYDSFRKLTGISNQDVDYGFTYDNFGRTTAVDVGANFNLTSNFYNSDGTLSSVTYGNNSTASFEYDEDNRVTAEIYDGVKTYEYDYTDEGQLSKLTDNENDVEWNYQYDMAGRLTAAHSDKKQLISYNYNNKNQLERFYVSDEYYIRSDTRYTYDDLGRVSQTSFPHFTYDEPVLSYNYDSFSRLTSAESEYSIEFPGEKMVTNYSYITKNGNQTGMVESIDYIKYDAEGTATPKSNISYEYDANGNITCVYENDVQTVKYYYDSLNRLIREDNANIDKTIVYNYDSSGDILSKVEYALTSDETLGTPTDTINYTYGDSVWKNGVTQYDGTDSITYDNMGNPLSYRGYTMTWVKGKQLSEMTKGDQTLSFKYDANGIRTSKTVNGVKIKYLYVGDKLLTMETRNGDLTFVYDVNGNPYAFYYADWAYYYMINLQGDVVGIYDYTGEVVVRYTYDSWGKLISVWGAEPFYDNLAALNPLRYRGYVYDNETQLYYLQSRYYDPELCRFISADSYLVAGNILQGTNMFTYCLNNPVRYSDPSGYLTGEQINKYLPVISVMLEPYLSGPELVCALDAIHAQSVNMSFSEFVSWIPGVINNIAGSTTSNVVIVDVANEALGIVGTAASVIADNSTYLVRGPYAIWTSATKYPNVSSFSQIAGNVATSAGMALTGYDIYNMWERGDLSGSQKIAGTAVEISSLLASSGVSALATATGSYVATAPIIVGAVSAPIAPVVGAIASAGVAVAGAVLIYYTANGLNKKIGV